MFSNSHRPIGVKSEILVVNRPETIVGHGGALVESIAFNRRVVGSTPALAAM